MIYLFWGLLIVNLSAFAAFGIDKYLAINGRRRIRERSLLLLALFGGTVGAISAQRLFRHKTQKFKIVLWNILIIQSAIVAIVMYYK